MPLKSCNVCGVRSTTRLCPTHRRTRDRNLARDVLARVYRRDGGICQVCHTMTAPLNQRGRHRNAPSVGHVTAVSHGGSDNLANLRLEHYGCNSAAGA